MRIPQMMTRDSLKEMVSTLMDNDLKNKIESLVRECEEISILQSKAKEEGKSVRVLNNYETKKWDAFRKIREIGDEAREEFSKLLDHERVDVRMFASVCMLRYKHKKAMKNLK